MSSNSHSSGASPAATKLALTLAIGGASALLYLGSALVRRLTADADTDDAAAHTARPRRPSPENDDGGDAGGLLSGLHAHHPHQAHRSASTWSDPVLGVAVAAPPHRGFTVDREERQHPVVALHLSADPGPPGGLGLVIEEGPHAASGRSGVHAVAPPLHLRRPATPLSAPCSHGGEDHTAHTRTASLGHDGTPPPFTDTTSSGSLFRTALSTTVHSTASLHPQPQGPPHLAQAVLHTPTGSLPPAAGPGSAPALQRSGSGQHIATAADALDALDATATSSLTRTTDPVLLATPRGPVHPATPLHRHDTPHIRAVTGSVEVTSPAMMPADVSVGHSEEAALAAYVEECRQRLVASGAIVPPLPATGVPRMRVTVAPPPDAGPKPVPADLHAVEFAVPLAPRCDGDACLTPQAGRPLGGFGALRASVGASASLARITASAAGSLHGIALVRRHPHRRDVFVTYRCTARHPIPASRGATALPQPLQALLHGVTFAAPEASTSYVLLSEPRHGLGLRLPVPFGFHPEAYAPRPARDRPRFGPALGPRGAASEAASLLRGGTQADAVSVWGRASAAGRDLTAEWVDAGGELHAADPAATLAPTTAVPAPCSSDSSDGDDVLAPHSALARHVGAGRRRGGGSVRSAASSRLPRRIHTDTAVGRPAVGLPPSDPAPFALVSCDDATVVTTHEETPALGDITPGGAPLLERASSAVIARVVRRFGRYIGAAPDLVAVDRAPASEAELQVRHQPAAAARMGDSAFWTALQTATAEAATAAATNQTEGTAGARAEGAWHVAPLHVCFTGRMVAARHGFGATGTAEDTVEQQHHGTCRVAVYVLCALPAGHTGPVSLADLNRSVFTSLCFAARRCVSREVFALWCLETVRSVTLGNLRGQAPGVTYIGARHGLRAALPPRWHVFEPALGDPCALFYHTPDVPRLVAPGGAPLPTVPCRREDDRDPAAWQRHLPVVALRAAEAPSLLTLLRHFVPGADSVGGALALEQLLDDAVAAADAVLLDAVPNFAASAFALPLTVAAPADTPERRWRSPADAPALGCSNTSLSGDSSGGCTMAEATAMLTQRQRRGLQYSRLWAAWCIDAAFDATDAAAQGARRARAAGAGRADASTDTGGRSYGDAAAGVGRDAEGAVDAAVAVTAEILYDLPLATLHAGDVFGPTPTAPDVDALSASREHPPETVPHRPVMALRIAAHCDAAVVAGPLASLGGEAQRDVADAFEEAPAGPFNPFALPPLRPFAAAAPALGPALQAHADAWRSVLDDGPRDDDPSHAGRGVHGRASVVSQLDARSARCDGTAGVTSVKYYVVALSPGAVADGADHRSLSALIPGPPPPAAGGGGGGPLERQPSLATCSGSGSEHRGPGSDDGPPAVSEPSPYGRCVVVQAKAVPSPCAAGAKRVVMQVAEALEPAHGT